MLTHDPGMYPQRAIVDDARRFGVPVLGVDINRSEDRWRVEETGGAWGVRASLADVKAVSTAEIARILAERPFYSLPDAANRARLSREVLDHLVLVGGFDALYGIGAASSAPRRRDLLLQVSALTRATRTFTSRGQVPLPLDGGPHIGGELPTMSEEECVYAELEVLGYESDRHVLDGHAELLAALASGHRMVRARDLHLVPAGQEVLVVGVKVATQTPAVRSGQRIIFATVDDATGLVDLTFFESVQQRCAATVFGSWLLAVRGRVRRAGSGMATVTATHAWDLGELRRAWEGDGARGLAEALHAEGPAGRTEGVGGAPMRYANGFRLSAYADLRSDPAPPRGLWHASPGSSGP